MCVCVCVCVFCFGKIRLCISHRHLGLMQWLSSGGGGGTFCTPAPGTFDTTWGNFHLLQLGESAPGI